MLPHHTAQLLVCHEHIGQSLSGGPREQRFQFCSLEAYAWCLDCEMYVCDIHLNTGHLLHRTQTRDEERVDQASRVPAAPQVDRRSGHERRHAAH